MIILSDDAAVWDEGELRLFRDARDHRLTDLSATEILYETVI
ncbi:MAG: hypothetical protein Q8O99_06120 [bacterium]|nr:hypothetical protein [bacterium]